MGGYECIDDMETSQMLLDVAKRKAKELDGKYLIGPMNGSTWQNYRFTVNNDQPSFFLEHIHQPYYPNQFIKAGFSLLSKYNSFLDPEIKLKPNKIRKVQTIL